MKCYHCHSIKCLEDKCFCYIVECRDGFTCANCSRCQNVLFLADEPYIQTELGENILGATNLIYEIVAKLHLAPYIAVKASQEYDKIKVFLPNSTKSNVSLILYVVKKQCDEEGIILSLKKLCFLMNVSEQDFFTTEKFLFKKKIEYPNRTNFQKMCESIFSCLKIYKPEITHVLLLECRKLQKKSDYRIENICACIFILYKYTVDRKKIKSHFKICEQKLDVKSYAIKKLLKKYYNINL